ncbi:aspartic peptidase domain-containing protein [Tricladium varicosporioides]|nr:aspartic peptidase domain-containing protein [Hymenoscyphus varicosporioides]
MLHTLLTTTLSLSALTFASTLPHIKRSDGVLRLPVAAKDIIPSTGSSRRQIQAGLTNIFGTVYIVTFSIGTPPQEVDLLIDTGSSETWVNPDCTTAGWKSLCDLIPLYKPGNSSTAKDLGVAGGVTYGKGFTDFEYFQDNFHIGGATVTNQIFGISTASAQIPAGIMGVGPGIELVGYPIIIDSLANQGITNSRAFSLDLRSVDSPSGAIIFGGIDTMKYTGTLEKCPIIPAAQAPNQSMRYWIYMKSMGITKPSQPSKTYTFNSGDPKGQPVFLDSGGTLSQIPTPLFNAIVADFNATPNPDGSGKYVIDCAIADQAGTVDFTFGATTIKVPWHEFVWKVGTTCNLGILPDDNEPVLGDSFLRAAFVVYDQDNQNLHLANAADCGTNLVAIGSGPNAVPSIAGACSPASSTTVSSISSTVSSSSSSISTSSSAVTTSTPVSSSSENVQSSTSSQLTAESTTVSSPTSTSNIQTSSSSSQVTAESVTSSSSTPTSNTQASTSSSSQVTVESVTSSSSTSTSNTQAPTSGSSQVTVESATSSPSSTLSSSQTTTSILTQSTDVSTSSSSSSKVVTETPTSSSTLISSTESSTESPSSTSSSVSGSPAQTSLSQASVSSSETGSSISSSASVTVQSTSASSNSITGSSSESITSQVSSPSGSVSSTLSAESVSTTETSRSSGNSTISSFTAQSTTSGLESTKTGFNATGSSFSAQATSTSISSLSGSNSTTSSVSTEATISSSTPSGSFNVTLTSFSSKATTIGGSSLTAANGTASSFSAEGTNSAQSTGINGTVSSFTAQQTSSSVSLRSGGNSTTSVVSAEATPISNSTTVSGAASSTLVSAQATSTDPSSSLESLRPTWSSFTNSSSSSAQVYQALHRHSQVFRPSFHRCRALVYPLILLFPQQHPSNQQFTPQLCTQSHPVPHLSATAPLVV